MSEVSELMAAFKNRDSNDANQVLQFLQAESPFKGGDKSL
jgi:hypothetical protein